MMTGLLLCALLTAAPEGDAAAPEPVRKYLADCEAAKIASIEAQEAAIKALGLGADPQKPKAAQAQLKRLKESPAALLPLRLPPEKDSIGIFAPPAPGDARGGRSVDVLEVVDEDDAILRVWYAPAPTSTDKGAPAEDPTFVDLWVHGVDTSELKASKPAQLPQVFQVTGSKVFETTCGSRSMLLLEPIDVEPFRAGKQEPAK